MKDVLDKIEQFTVSNTGNLLEAWEKCKHSVGFVWTTVEIFQLFHNNSILRNEMEDFSIEYDAFINSINKESNIDKVEIFRLMQRYLIVI